MMRFLALFVSCFLLISSPARADLDYQAIDIRLSQQVFEPAFSRLSQSASAQARLWDAACRQGSEPPIDDLRQAFHQVSDNWADVFHWNIGPITHFLRRDRFYHWPERRNSIGKSLSRLMASKDPSKLQVERFKKASVAVQGLPALERILFEKSDVLQDPWACQIGQAIALNLAAISNEVLSAWRQDVAAPLQAGTANPDFFEEPIDFLNRVFNELTTGYAIIVDQKILPVMGSELTKAKPNLIENRRSQRFFRNLNHNVQALFSTQRLLNSYLSTETAAKLDTAFQASERALKDMNTFENLIRTPEGRTKIQDFVASLKVAQDLTTKAYADELGLTVGFNSLDGD